MFNLKLADNAAVLHRSFTVILSILGTIISTIELAWPMIDDSAKTLLTPTQYVALMLGIYVLIGIGRYIQQQSVSNPKTQE